MAKKLKIFNSDTVPRINSKDVIGAYKDLNFKVHRENYFMKKGNNMYACGLGALYASLVIQSTQITLQQFWDNYIDAPISKELHIAFGYSENYLCGYVRGFDGGALPELVHQEYLLGYEDGKSCYNRVKK